MPLPLLILGWGAIVATIGGLFTGVFSAAKKETGEALDSMFFWVTVGGGLLTLFHLLPSLVPGLRRSRRRRR